MELAKALFDYLGEVTAGYKEKNKETSLVKLLDRAIRSVEVAVSAMDAFLKKKGIDVGKSYKDAKNASKWLMERISDKLATDAEGNKTTLFKGLKERGLGVASSLLDKFEKFRTNTTPPPEGEAQEEQPTDGKDLIAKVKDKLNQLRSTTTETDKAEQEEQSFWERRKERANKRKEEIAEEKRSLLSRAKKKKGKKSEGWLGKILGMGGTLASVTQGGFLGLGKHMLTELLPGIGGMLFGDETIEVTQIVDAIKVVGDLLNKFVPSLSETMARASSSGIWGLGKTLVKGAGRLAMQGLRALPSVTGGVLGGVARGAAMLLTGPVGWGLAIGSALYGGYKLYKYMTRNDIRDDIYGRMIRLRLLTYGFDDNRKDHYSKLFELDMLMKGNTKFDTLSGKLTIEKPTNDQIQEIHKIFEVDPADEKKKAALNHWFAYRYIPAYHAFMVALYTVNNRVYLDSIEDIGALGIEKFVSVYKLPVDVFSHTQIPTFEDPTSTVQLRDAEIVLAGIKSLNKDALPKPRLTPTRKIQQEIAAKRTQETVERATEAAREKAGLPPPASSQPKPTKPLMMLNPMAEGENNPDSTVGVMSNPSSQAGGVNLAGGPLRKGAYVSPDGELMNTVGIKTKLRDSAIAKLDPKMRDLFTGMAEEYALRTGKRITLNSGYRSMAEQERLYRTMPPGKAAKPGASLHEYGLAVDINSEDTMELERLGLLRKYGFTASVGGEKWHLEPIGVALDPQRAKTDLEFRKRAVAASPGKGGGGYGLLDNAKRYKRDIELQRRIFEGNVKVTESGSDQPVRYGETITIGQPSLPEETKPTSTTAGPTSTPATFNPNLDKSKTSTVEASASPAPIGPMANLQAGGGVSEGEPKMQNQLPDQLPKSRSVLSFGGGGYAGSIRSIAQTGDYSNLSPTQAIKLAASMTGINEQTLLTFGKLESGLRPGVQNPNSSAAGLFQITDGTWKELVQKYGQEYGLPPDADKKNPLYNALMAAKYAQENLSKVSGYQSLGLDDETALYLTHHFGPTGGKRIIKAYAKDPNTPMKNVTSSGAYKANQAAIGGKTVAGYIQSLKTKFTVAQNTPASAYTGTKTTTSYPDQTLPAKTDTDYGTMTASYKPAPEPRLSNTAYDITRTDIPVKTTASTQPSITPNIDTGNMESLLKEQLSALTQMVGIMSSIDNKLDFDKLLKNLPKQEQPTQASPSPRTAGGVSTAVDLTRRSIGA